MKKAYIIPKHRIAEIDLKDSVLIDNTSFDPNDYGDEQDVRGERHLDSEEGTTSRRNIWSNEW